MARKAIIVELGVIFLASLTNILVVLRSKS